MPSYRFHLYQSGESYPDIAVRDLTGPDEVEDAALKAALRLAAQEKDRTGAVPRDGELWITGAVGNVVLMIPLVDAMEKRMPASASQPAPAKRRTVRRHDTLESVARCRQLIENLSRTVQLSRELVADTRALRASRPARALRS